MTMSKYRKQTPLSEPYEYKGCQKKTEKSFNFIFNKKYA